VVILSESERPQPWLWLLLFSLRQLRRCNSNVSEVGNILSDKLIILPKEDMKKEMKTSIMSTYSTLPTDVY